MHSAVNDDHAVEDEWSPEDERYSRRGVVPSMRSDANDNERCRRHGALPSTMSIAINSEHRRQQGVAVDEEQSHR